MTLATSSSKTWSQPELQEMVAGTQRAALLGAPFAGAVAHGVGSASAGREHGELRSPGVPGPQPITWLAFAERRFSSAREMIR